VPTHIEQRPLPSEPLSSYLARRAEELNLPPEQNRARLPGVVAFGRFSFRLTRALPLGHRHSARIPCDAPAPAAADGGGMATGAREPESAA
jgi:hypothetical protein